jgi:outer membrane protein assembly factor BamB
LPPLWGMTREGEALVAPAIPGYVRGSWAGRRHAAVLADGPGLAVVRARIGDQSVLACHEASSGNLLWTRILNVGPNSTFPPAVDESALYVGLVDGKVYALDLQTGEGKWDQQVGDPLEESIPASSQYALAPICSLAGDILWVVYRGSLLALNARTGEIEWQTDETEAAWYEPVISDGQLYLSTIHGIEAWGPDRGHSTLQETPDTAETTPSPGR